MKHILLFLFLLGNLSGITQNNTTWSTPIKGNAKTIFFHEYTKTPLVETSDAFYGIDPTQKSILWTIDKSALKNTLKTAQTITAIAGTKDITQGMDLSEYREIPYTSFAVIAQQLINVTNGQVILGDATTPFRQWISYDIIPQLYLLLAKVTDGTGNLRLYAINFLTDKIEWNIKLADKDATKNLIKFMSKYTGMDQFSVNVFVPCVNAEGNIVYNNDGKLCLLDGKKGNIIWENECNPGTFFTDDQQKHIFVIEKRSGMANVMSLSGPKAFGKKVSCLDAENGKNIWNNPVKLESTYVLADFSGKDKILLAHKDGFNLYDIHSGKKVWKKDYSSKNLKEINMTPQGIEVQYGNKLMLVNTETGKKAWKKPIEFKDVDENSKFDFIRKEYNNTTLMVVEDAIIAFNKKSGKRIWKRSLSKDAKIAFDDANNKVLVINAKAIYLFEPDNQAKKPKAIDIKIEEPKEICGYEIIDNKYFIYGDKEYLLLDKEGNLIKHTTYHQLATKRLAKAGLLAGKIFSGILSTRVQFSNDQASSEQGLFVDLEHAKQFEESFHQQTSLLNQLNENERYRKSARTDNEYAYFLKGVKENSTDQLSIVIVKKGSGEEVRTIDFCNNRNVIYEIDSNNRKLYFIDGKEFKILDL